MLRRHLWLSSLSWTTENEEAAAGSRFHRRLVLSHDPFQPPPTSVSHIYVSSTCTLLLCPRLRLQPTMVRLALNLQTLCDSVIVWQPSLLSDVPDLVAIRSPSSIAATSVLASDNTYHFVRWLRFVLPYFEILSCDQTGQGTHDNPMQLVDTSDDVFGTPRAHGRSVNGPTVEQGPAPLRPAQQQPWMFFVYWRRVRALIALYEKTVDLSSLSTASFATRYIPKS